jgi:lipid II:glycine glycyltransferase (peptidoglycan interpeptide bridge formation enzyme)
MSTMALVMEEVPEITVTAVDDRKTWDALFSFAPRTHFTQAWCHGEGRRAEGWQVERLLFSDEDGIAAICQMLVKRPLGARVTRIDRGPVFLREDPSRELQLAVLRALRRRFRFGLRGLLLLAPSLPRGDASTALMREAGFWNRQEAGRVSSCVDLNLPLEELHRRLAPEWRVTVRRAKKLGVGLRLRRDTAGVEWLLDRFENPGGAVGGPSPAYLRRVCASSPGDFWLLQAMIEGQPEAALLVCRSGQHAEVLATWYGDRARQAAAGNFLTWNAVIETHRGGCRTLDLGGQPIPAVGNEYPLAGEWLAI